MRVAESDDDVLGELIVAAGARAPVPAESLQRVRTAVHAEWRAGLRRRTVRRRVAIVVSLAVAAMLVAVAARVVILPRAVIPAATLAVVERVEGSVTRAVGKGDDRLRARDEVRGNEWLRTEAGARLALRLSNGSSVRLDASSRLKILSARTLELERGAVYIDTDTLAPRLEIRTPLGIARDIGTQFELRLAGGVLRLRVRTGVVELADSSRSMSGQAGTEVLWSATDIATRPFPAFGAEWEWIAALSPTPVMEGASLAVFLEQVAREQGWTLRYQDPQLEHEAAGIVLHGSGQGLSAHEAVDVAVTASGLGARLESGQLHVSRREQSR